MGDQYQAHEMLFAAATAAHDADPLVGKLQRSRVASANSSSARRSPVFKLVGVVQNDVSQLVQTMEVTLQYTAVLHPNLHQQRVSCIVALHCGLHEACTSNFTLIAR